jgi:hypothetical protein
MELPFTSDQFLAMFEQYNQAIWPTQVLMYILGLGVVFLVVNEVPHMARLISSSLALIWLWNGLVFQILYFREINGAPAIFFGLLMIVQQFSLLSSGSCSIVCVLLLAWSQAGSSAPCLCSMRCISTRYSARWRDMHTHSHRYSVSHLVRLPFSHSGFCSGRSRESQNIF